MLISCVKCVAGQEASPQLTDKIHTGLLLSLWESLTSIRVGRGGNDGACAATVRAYFECLLHGWQTTVESGADRERIQALTTAGLLPCIDALLTPDGRGTNGVPGGRAGLLAATVKCTELLCSRRELAAARSSALQVVETRLLSCRIVGGAEDMDDGLPAEEAREISALVCAFKLHDSAGCKELLPIMGSLCKKLQARCWEMECEEVIRLPQLGLLCDITSHWGVNVLSEGTGEQPFQAASALMSESIIPLVSSTLVKRTGEEGMNRSLPDDAKKLLDVVFRLVGLLVKGQPSSEQGENALWIALLKSVAGGSELPGDCARVEAVAMLVRCAGSFKGPMALSKQLICVMLDGMVHDASVRLLLRQGHSEEPGMLLSARLHELILAVLPQTSKGGRTDFLISEKALENLIQRLTRVMCFWTDDSAKSRGKTMEDECLVEGSSVTAAMSSAAMAGLDTVECVLWASQTGRLPSSCSNFVSPILSALFRLRVHSEDMIGGAADTDRAHQEREHNSDRPSYDYDANSARRLRSRTGLRACTVWDKCARVVLIDVLREQGSRGVSWLLDRARETRESISASLLVTEALVLGDQASEIISVAKACEHDVSSILAVLFEDSLALPQGSSTTQHVASMWLAFGLRFLHSVEQETVIAQLELEISSKRETSPILWLLEELVLAYGGNSAFKPVQGVLSRPSCAADQMPCVWSHAAVSGTDDENVEASSCSQQPAQAPGAAEGKIENILPDIQLAWNKLVTPIVIGRAGNAAGAACVSNIAHHLVFKCLSKTVEGHLQWPQALGHLLSLLAQSGDTKYLRLCEEMMTTSGAGNADAMLQGSGILLVGKARLIVVLVKMVADLLCRSESEVQKSEASDVLLYCNSPGQVEEVTLLAVHREEFPPFFSIRMSDGREKQTEAHRLSSIPWLSSISPEGGTAVSTAAELLNTLRDLLKALAIVCAQYILQNSAHIGAALSCDEEEEAGTRAVASLVLVALRELCRCRQHHLMGSDLWLQVLESSCQWFDPGRQIALPSPESAYMLAATAGLVTGGHDVGLDSELTGYRIADSLGCDPGGQIDAHVLSYWLAQLAAEPRGGCVRALCSRPAAWAQLAARVHLVIVSKAFWGSAAQGMAMQVLQIAEAYALVPLAGADPSAGAPVADGADSEDEVIEVIDDEDGDEDEVIEILDDEDEEDDKVQQGGKQADAAKTKPLGASVHVHVAWDRSRFCGFAHVLGELISVRDTPVAGLAPQYVSRVRLLATVAAAAPKEVLQLTLVHLDRKRRQALCDALHLLLPATDVVVQTSAYMLLSRFYTLPALLMHLDALEWEGLEPEREDEEDASPSTPTGTCTKQTTDLLRAVPAPLARALRTSADAAGQSGGASPAAAEDALMSTECLGVLLAWLLVLEFRPRCSARLQGNLSAYLRNQPLLQPLLSIAFAHVVSSDALASPGGNQQLPSVASLEKAPQLAKLGTEEADDAMTDLAGHILFRSVAAFPSLVRLWYNDLDRGTASRVDKFVASCISPLILAKEVSVISGAAASMDDAGELSIRASSKTREITAAYTKDEAVLEVVLRVPPSYPLRPIQVDGTRRVGVSEGKWKKWALAMRTLLDNKDGSLLDAVLLASSSKLLPAHHPCATRVLPAAWSPRC